MILAWIHVSKVNGASSMSNNVAQICSGPPFDPNLTFQFCVPNILNRRKQQQLAMVQSLQTMVQSLLGSFTFIHFQVITFIKCFLEKITLFVTSMVHNKV